MAPCLFHTYNCQNGKLWLYQFLQNADGFFRDLAFQLARFAVPVLLTPILPLLGWGPLAHIYINKRALERIKPEDAGNDNIRQILTDENLKRVFLNASNSVDLIKANNLRNRERFFEYAHNTIPNYFTGDPIMGKYLVERISERNDNPIKLTWAYGWLSHQVSDGFAHKIPHAGCEGWVNSRRVLAGYYRPEKEDEPVSISEERINLYMADHWLVEMLADCLCYLRVKDSVDNLKIDLSIPTNGEVTQASIRILKEFEKQLGPGYVYFKPLTDEKLRSITDFYKLLILCSLNIHRAILRAYPQDGFERFIKASPRLSRLDELLEFSIEAVVHMLKHPENPWEPRRWLPGGSNDFSYSVYEYERIWRPGRYKFGRKEGLIGKIYYNRYTEKLIKWAADTVENIDILPLVNLGISTLYRKGKTQWPIAGAFIRTLIKRKPENVEEAMAIVAKHCGLKKYPEIIPD